MKITVFCSDRKHPVWSRMQEWVRVNASFHEVELVESPSECSGGDILFLISCTVIVKPEVRNMYANSFVVHASDLPNRRGWSPHVWAILEGESEIVVSLIGADDPVDSGRIFHQTTFSVSPHELIGEINDKLFGCETQLMDWAVENAGSYSPRDQSGTPTWCRRRSPADSELDPTRSIESQFDKIRLADAERYPAYFELHGHRYVVTIEKVGQL